MMGNRIGLETPNEERYSYSNYENALKRRKKSAKKLIMEITWPVQRSRFSRFGLLSGLWFDLFKFFSFAFSFSFLFYFSYGVFCFYFSIPFACCIFVLFCVFIFGGDFAVKWLAGHLAIIIPLAGHLANNNLFSLICALTP